MTLSSTHLSAQPAEEQRLYRGEAVLEDGQSLAELGVQNDEELGLAYRLPDGERIRAACCRGLHLTAGDGLPPPGCWHLATSQPPHYLTTRPAASTAPMQASLRCCTSSGLTKAARRRRQPGDSFLLQLPSLILCSPLLLPLLLRCCSLHRYPPSQ